ncbi:unnamed protein product, partial [Protopolystoma xenopodis]
MFPDHILILASEYIHDQPYPFQLPKRVNEFFYKQPVYEATGDLESDETVNSRVVNLIVASNRMALRAGIQAARRIVLPCPLRSNTSEEFFVLSESTKKETRGGTSNFEAEADLLLSGSE